MKKLVKLVAEFGTLLLLVLILGFFKSDPSLKDIHQGLIAGFLMVGCGLFSAWASIIMKLEETEKKEKKD